MPRWLLPTAAAALVLLVLAVGLFACLAAGESPSLRASNGSKLVLDGVFYNQPTRVLLGDPWKKLAVGLIPSLQKDLGVTSISDPPGSQWRGRLVTWCHVAGDTGKSPDLCLVDAHGCEFPGYMNFTQLSDPDRPQSLRQEFPLFPRRERQLRMRVDLSSTDSSTAPETAGEFNITNPAYNHYPVWTPEALPATRHCGPFSVTLAEFRESAREGQWPVVTVRYRVRREGRTVPDWRPISAKLSDAAGGVCQHWDWESTWAKTGTIPLAGGICWMESAYGLQLEFSQADTPGTIPDAVWQAPPVRCTGAGLNESVPLPQGARLEFQGDLVMSTPDQAVLASVTQPGEGLRFRLKVRDNLGRSIPVQSYSYFLPEYDLKDQQFLLRIPADARQLHVSVEVFRSRYAEWKVKPVRRKRP